MPQDTHETALLNSWNPAASDSPTDASAGAAARARLISAGNAESPAQRANR